MPDLEALSPREGEKAQASEKETVQPPLKTSVPKPMERSRKRCRLPAEITYSEELTLSNLISKLGIEPKPRRFLPLPTRRHIQSADKSEFSFRPTQGMGVTFLSTTFFSSDLTSDRPTKLTKRAKYVQCGEDISIQIISNHYKKMSDAVVASYETGLSDVTFGSTIDLKKFEESLKKRKTKEENETEGDAKSKTNRKTKEESETEEDTKSNKSEKDIQKEE